MLMYVSTEKQDRPIIFKMNSNGVKSLKNYLLTLQEILYIL